MVIDTGKVPFTLALKTKDSSRLGWEEEDGADELLPSLLTDTSSPPLEQQVSKTMFRSVSLPRLSSNLSEGHGHGLWPQGENSLGASEAEVQLQRPERARRQGCHGRST